MALDIRHDRDQERFFIELEGRQAVLDYSALDGEKVDFRSTYVPREMRGRQIGDKLVRHALDWAREQGYQVVPTCPFVSTVVERHPEYQSLVTETG